MPKDIQIYLNKHKESLIYLIILIYTSIYFNMLKYYYTEVFLNKTGIFKKKINIYLCILEPIKIYINIIRYT